MFVVVMYTGALPKLSSYEYTAAVNADTNGLKTAVKNADGTYSFSARQTGNGKSFAEQDISVAANITSTVKDATGYWPLTVYALGYTDTTSEEEEASM